MAGIPKLLRIKPLRKLTKTKEKSVQDSFKEKVENEGLLFVKIMMCSINGFPDSIILGQGALIIFAELKRPRKDGSAQTKVDPEQRSLRTLLKRWGFRYVVISTKEEVDAFSI